MTVAEVLKVRRACRSFTAEPLASGIVDGLIDRARRTPTAGNCQGVEFLVLEGDDVEAYWTTTLSPERKESFPWPGLLLAPALVIPCGIADRYVERYSESDKIHTGLGESVEKWPVPYWLVDAAFAALALQLLSLEAGLGSCFFGMFEHEASVAARFSIPPGSRAVGTVALGYPDPDGGRPSTSANRHRRPLEEIIHRGSW